MVDFKEPPKKPKKDDLIELTNVTKRNIFTEQGRVLPGGKVKLLRSVAARHDGLKQG